MEIKAQRWIAVWYKCEKCGSQTANTMLTPSQYRRSDIPVCRDWPCESEMLVAEKRWYTTFVVERTVSFTTIAGTLSKIGPFKVCDIVHSNIHAFRKWVVVRKEEQAEQHRQYLEYWRRVEEEANVRREQQRKEAIQLKEAEAVASRHMHVPSTVSDPDPDWDDDEHPF